MYDLKIRNFILSHEDWEELLQSPPYNLIISRDEGYIMFKYSQIASDFNEPIVKEARGIIFREENWECVCHAFDKFGNYGSYYTDELDWNSVKILEKIDGSLIKLYHDNGWRIATNGIINAFKANTGDVKYPTFGDLFLAALNEPFLDLVSTLDINRTYMFELVSPYNRVVVPYENIELYYLGERDMVSGQEYSLPERWNKVPRVYTFNKLNDIIKTAEELPWDEEGYVCVDKDFHRCKIKSPSYVLAHYSRNNNVITQKRLLEVILRGEVDEFCIYCSDYKDEIYKLINNMDSLEEIAEFAKPQQQIDISKKEYANYVLTFPEVIQDFLFKNYYKDITWKEYTFDWDIHKWDKVLKEYGRIRK